MGGRARSTISRAEPQLQGRKSPSGEACRTLDLCRNLQGLLALQIPQGSPAERDGKPECQQPEQQHRAGRGRHARGRKPGGQRRFHRAEPAGVGMIEPMALPVRYTTPIFAIGTDRLNAATQTARQQM